MSLLDSLSDGRRLLGRAPTAVLVSVLLVAACGKKKDNRLPIETAAAARRTIVSEATASGAVEPINVVDVRSKSSGQIIEMRVETGTLVKQGDLLVQLDTRDVDNQYEQAQADLSAARAKLDVSTMQLKRSRDLAASRIITDQELETAQLDSTNSASALIRAQTSLDLALQRKQDATVKAPVAGTIIAKTVSLGQVIASATSSASGGTSLLQMADLSKVRVRANFNETDIANVHPGQEATATFDAYPDRPFRGTVEKIEPQAVVQQSVTMFPVLVTLDNLEGYLKPGMNGEVSVLVDTREDVITVPNDAIRTTREAATTARLLGLDPDSVTASVQEQMRSMGGGFGGGGMRGGRGGDSGANGRRQAVSKGDVALDDPQQGQGGRGGRRGGANLPQVTDKDCAKVHDAFAKHPDAQGALQALRGRGGQGAEVDPQVMRAKSDSIYKVLGVDANIARACNFRDRQQAGGQSQQGGTGATPGSSGRSGRRGGGASPMQGATQGGSGAPVRAGELSIQRARTRTSLVYVADSGRFAPRVIRSGLSDLDYTEVVSGLQEGEQVVLLAAVQLQAQRDSANARARNMQGLPGMQKGGNIPGGGPGGGGRRGGG